MDEDRAALIEQEARRLLDAIKHMRGSHTLSWNVCDARDSLERALRDVSDPRDQVRSEAA